MSKIFFIIQAEQPVKTQFAKKLVAHFSQHQFSFLVVGASSSTQPSVASIPIIPADNHFAIQVAMQSADEVWLYLEDTGSEPDPALWAVPLAALAAGKLLRKVQNLDAFTFVEPGVFSEMPMDLVSRVLIQQVGTIQRQQKEIDVRAQQLENLIQQVIDSNLYTPPSLMTRLHRVRMKIIPENSKVENFYYRVRNFIYRVGRSLRRRILGKGGSYSYQPGLGIPDWWKDNLESDPIYDLLDSFWLKYADTKNHAIIISAVPLSQEDHHSIQLARQLQQRNIAVVFAYFRFTNAATAQQTSPSLENNIFELPLDMLWANPQRVFGSLYAPQKGCTFFIEFPHPLLFRLVNLANQNGWMTIYDTQENWANLKAHGLADWYNPAFENYLVNNVRLKGGRMFDEVQSENAASKTLEVEKVPSLIPGWWKKLQLDQNMLKELNIFCSEHMQAEGCVVFLSGVLFTRSEGQRVTWLTRAFTRMGIPVVFAYFRFAGQEIQPQDPQFPDVFQIPIDQLWAFPGEYLNLLRQTGPRKLFVAEFPHPALIRLTNMFRVNQWTAVYETIDDWAEFHRVGQADWYDEGVERYIMANMDQLVATAETLADRVAGISKRTVDFLPNAFEQGSLARSDTPRDLQRGESLTIGYFGHLTSSWFDWPMLIQTAQRHPDWLFHIIGYGYDNEIPLPANILLLGKVAHEELPHYAANWNVAIIPFKVTRLSGGVNPIKVYEYLQLQLPVVACGMPHLSKFPYVQNAQDAMEFETCVQKAAEMRMDAQILREFLAQNTWGQRARSLLNKMIREAK